MDIKEKAKKIAIVRATNVIPFDGVVRPISEVPYLVKEEGTQFSNAMQKLLATKGIFKEIDYNKLYETVRENEKILKQYMPYNSGYNSMVLWALNGLVPDDMNNTFSDKTCAIIEGLAEQIEQSEIISLVPTDTAIKGCINLSNEATILINKQRYESLLIEEKEQLAKLNLNIVIFDGDLKETIDKELTKNGRFTAETLSLKREFDGYIKSDTSDEVRKIIYDIANERNIAQVLYFNVITGQNDELDKLINVNDEFENYIEVRDFYKNEFFKYLFSKMDIDNKVKENALYSLESSQYMNDLCIEIDRIGIDKYKSVVDEYNKSLEKIKEKRKLPTPQQIVDSLKNKEKIDLITMIEELNKENDVLSGAVTLTESTIKISDINESTENLNLIVKGRRIASNDSMER